MKGNMFTGRNNISWVTLRHPQSV